MRMANSSYRIGISAFVRTCPEQILQTELLTSKVYNVKSHLWLMHAAKAELEKTEGAFVTTASIAGVKPSGSSLPYSVTKAASIHLSKALAVICSPKVRVNAVSPGLLLTEWGMKFPEEKREAARDATKLKRLATVEVSAFIKLLVNAADTKDRIAQNK